MNPVTSAALKWTRRLAWVVACTAAPAQAAVYTGVWDPTYGAPFTNLGWRGSADYFVPGACESGTTADVDNAADCGGAAAVTRAEVEFYDIRDASLHTLATLVFDPLSLNVSTLRYVEGLLSGLLTSSSNAVGAAADLTAFGVSSGTQFSLQFTLGGPRLTWQSCARDYDECGRGVNDATQFPAAFAISRVPEPASLALAALALVALGASRRRR